MPEWRRTRLVLPGFGHKKMQSVIRNISGFAFFIMERFPLSYTASAAK